MLNLIYKLSVNYILSYQVFVIEDVVNSPPSTDLDQGGESMKIRW